MPRGDRGGSSRGMGVRCVAIGCGKTSADGVSVHSFPKDPSVRRQWTDFVKTRRGHWNGPTEYSAICSFHFKPECYPFRHRFEIEHMQKIPKNARLICDAVPTIHACTVTQTVATESDSDSHKSSTFSTPSKMPRLDMLSPSHSATSQSQTSPPKKLRLGFAKREAARIITEYDEEQARQRNKTEDLELEVVSSDEVVAGSLALQ